MKMLSRRGLFLALAVACACSDGTSPDESAVRMCADRRFDWFAHRDASGRWIRAEAVRLPAKATIAFAEVGSRIELRVVSATSEQFARVRCTSGFSMTGTKQLSGYVTGIGDLELATIAMGGSGAVAYFPPRSFQLDRVENGSLDLIAVRERFGEALPDRIIVRRGLDLPSGSVIPDIDFESAEAFAPDTRTLTIEGAERGEDVATSLQLETRGVRGIQMGRLDIDAGETGLTGRLAFLPADRRADGDLYWLSAGISGSNVDEQGAVVHVMQNRWIHAWLSTPSDLSFSLGSFIGEPALEVNVTPGGHAIVELRIASNPQFSSLISAYYYEYDPDRVVSVAATPEFLGGLPAEWVLTLPDLRGVEGFDPEWTLQTPDFAWEVVMAELTPGSLIGEWKRAGEAGLFAAAGQLPLRTIVGRFPTIMW